MKNPALEAIMVYVTRLFFSGEGAVMFQRVSDRSLFAWSLSACLCFGACTKSHDVEPSEQPLAAAGHAAGSGGRSGAGAGRGGSAGGIAVGRAGNGAAGRAGNGSAGRAGSAAAAGRGGATGGSSGAAGGTALSCGTCASANIFNILPVSACCTSDNKCGLDLSSLGIAMCVEQNAPGTLDANCPAGMTMGFSM
ncbi:MAG TPA: hypothetical protein VGI70_08895, partial [Polyangiales bacterium]